jgi:hypothetical protein
MTVMGILMQLMQTVLIPVQMMMVTDTARADQAVEEVVLRETVILWTRMYIPVRQRYAMAKTATVTES